MASLASSQVTQGDKPLDSDLLHLYCSSLYRKCSNCGRTGHNSRTCLEARTDLGSQGNAQKDRKGEAKETSGKAQEDVDASDASDHKSKAGGRKKGVAWTEDEHKQFLNGLAKLGKGNWRGISRHFVQSKSPTQVASHAQKYFIRQAVNGKRKRRSSLFDLVPENEGGRERESASQATTHTTVAAPVKAEQSEKLASVQPSLPSNVPPAPSMQGPDAAAWAYWYQTMMMQQDPMNWMSSVPGSMQPPNMPAKLGPPQTQGPVPPPGNGPIPAMFTQMANNGPDPNNPAFAAYLAQQSQMAAMMAMNYMPQLSPEYLARYAAGLQIHLQSAHAAQQAAQSAASTKQSSEKQDTEGIEDDNLSDMNATPSQTVDEKEEEPRSKFPRRSDNASRFDLSNASTETEDFGNGALVKPKAKKVNSWVELPIFLQDRKDGGSLLNSNSKQSQSTQFASHLNPAWTTRSPAIDAQTLSSQNHRDATSASTAVERTNSEEPSTVLDPNLATSHYKAQSEISNFQPIISQWKAIK